MSKILDSLMGALDSVISFIPNIIGALIFLLIAWIIAVIVKNIIIKGLGALGFESWLQEKGLVDAESGKSESAGLIQTFGKLA